MSPSLLSYLYDPVLRAPTIGSMLMCLSAALIGVIIFLRKQSLIGETLSHAAYPGVILGVIFAAFFGLNDSYTLPIMGGAFITSILGLWCINFLVGKCRIRADSALCFVLASFFGIGLTFASRVQFTHSGLYKQTLSYLYGQAATMTDIHIVIYGSLSLVMIITLFTFYKEIQVITFDRDYAKSLQIPVNKIDSIVFILVVLAVVIGIRSVGVVLMSAMIIAPAAAARQYTQKLSIMLLLASIFGVISGYLGNVLSVAIGNWPSERIALPTGPMIVIVATVIAGISLLFAPERGLVTRMVRIFRFRFQCLSENILKQIWRHGPKQPMTLSEIQNYQNISRLYLRFICRRLIKNGWLKKGYVLTPDGEFKAAQIVRLHRLWEVYLADYLGMGAEKVHKSAEEMEHILTPELEKELTVLLKNPQKDPHQQPIPPKPGEP